MNADNGVVDCRWINAGLPLADRQPLDEGKEE